jgi:hypothetical protein
MANVNSLWLAQQRKRFMRPDAWRYMRPDAARWMRPKPYMARPTALAADALTDAAAIKAERAELLGLKALAAERRFYVALRRFSRKYREDQPRDDHGRWVYDGGRRQRVRLAAGDKPTLGPKAFAAIGLEVAKRAIEVYRKTNNLMDLFGNRIGTVSYTEFKGQIIYGSNSTSPTYTSGDRREALRLRDVLMEKYPDVMKTDDIGRRPNDALFHAEANALMRAARANSGTLAGQTITIHSDRPLCPSCSTALPYVGLELGNPTVTFVGPSGKAKTMRDGRWAE